MQKDNAGSNMASHLDVPDVHLNLDQITHHTELPHTVLSRRLDKFLNIIGNLSSWIWVVLMLVIIFNVAMRYLFSQGRIEFEELQWHLYAVGWLVGLSYCFVHDDHVRVELLHDHFRPKVQAWVECLGLVFLLLPFLCIVAWYSVPFVAYAIETKEVSSAPGGLPYRWIIKAALPLAMGLLMLAAVSRLSRVIALISAKPVAEVSHGN